MRLELVNVEQKRINGVGHTTFVTLDKFVLCQKIGENVMMQTFPNDIHHTNINSLMSLAISHYIVSMFNKLRLN